MFLTLFPTFLITSILLSSSISAYFICKLYNYPFINPEHYLKDKIKNISLVTMCVIINYHIIYEFYSKYYLYIQPISFLQRLFNILYFICILEFIAYFYHRLSHSKYLYKYTHYDHHKNIIVYPIDFLEFDYLDNIAQTLYINLPLYFIPMNYYDYLLVYYIYSVGAFLIHSNLITEYHVLHHKYFKCNYGILLPVYDILFNTYKV